MSRTYLTVKFEQKDAAKALGARWDAEARKWYVPPGLALQAFAAWLPEADQALAVASSSPSSAAVVRAPEPGYGTAVALPDAPQGVTLSGLLAGVSTAVASAYAAGVWTRVEVVSVSGRNGHIYLELTERTPDGQALASARGMIWSQVAQRILPEFERVSGVQIAPGLKLLVRARPVFKAQYGFSLEIEALDPSYTLGELEARKRQIRLRLQQEGVFQQNQALPPVWDYTCVLVIAPRDAAGLGDFQAEAQRLEHAGLCQFVYAHSRFQGEGAAQDVLAALHAAWVKMNEQGLTPDAVAIIRGGGAVNDLAWLNDYDLAHAVCTWAVPVLTGIGHARDSTVLDEVAHTRFDTPSKVIAGIEGVIVQRSRQAQAHFDQVLGHAVHAVTQARQDSQRDMNTVQTLAHNGLAQARQRSERCFQAVATDARASLALARQNSADQVNRVRYHATASLGQARGHVQAQLQAVSLSARNDVARCRDTVARTLPDITTRATQLLSEARTACDALMREVAGQGPQKTLSRGFAIVRDASGQPVTSRAAALSAWSEAGGPDSRPMGLEVEFHDGRIPLEPQRPKPNPKPTHKPAS